MSEHNGWRKEFQLAQIIWYSMLLSVMIYGYIAQRVVSEGPAADPGGESVFYVFLVISSLGLGFLGRIKSFFPHLAGLPAAASPTNPPKASLLLIAFIVVYALSEVPAILGLIAAILTHQLNHFYILAAFSLGALFLNFPKMHEWERWYDERHSGGPLS